MDLFKIIVAKSTEADYLRANVNSLAVENETLRRRLLAASKIVPLREVKQTKVQAELMAFEKELKELKELRAREAVEVEESRIKMENTNHGSGKKAEHTPKRNNSSVT